jgi:GT2 family glycosyltransferase
VFVVQHLAGYALRGPKRSLINYTEVPPNISRAWNMGLKWADTWAIGEPYDVAVLNDDAIVPDDWFKTITDGMRATGAAGGAAARADDHRMAGFAFILDGDAHLFADEQFEWWYGDDDLERRARLAGGVFQAPGLHVEHRHPNSTTVGILAEKAEADGVRFRTKWGL